MDELKLYLLGTPRVEQAGRPFDVDTRKATALLAYLAVTGEAQSRDTLASLLWPDYDTASARGALRRTLSSLRSALAGDWLIANRDKADIRRDVLWVDVAEAGRLETECSTHGHPASQYCQRCVPLLSAAAALYRGNFLDGFSLRDSLEFEDWQSLQADLYRRKHAGLLERLVTAHAAAQHYPEAIEHARKWLALDPLQEGAHCMLMRLYTWSGDRSAALRQYRDLVRVLSEELDVSPLDETRDLHQAIVEDRLRPPEAPATVAAQSTQAPASEVIPPATAETLPLTGRDSDLEALKQAYASIRTDGRIAFIEGEAGIGKSRLAEEFARWAVASSARVLQARCYEGESSFAYAPFIELLRAGHAAGGFEASDAAKTEAARLLPDVAPPGSVSAAPLDNPGALSRFVAGVWDVVTAMTGPRGVVLLEDLQWADDASLDLLTYMARRLKDREVMLVVTWRTESVPSQHRIRHLLAESSRKGESTHLMLGRLDQAATQAMVEQSAIDAEPRFAQRLYEETEGVPFLVVQYLQAATQGLLGDEAGWALPEDAQAVLQSRLAAVSQPALQLLAAAAVIGRSFSFDTVREASGRSDDETLTTLEELLRTAVVREIASTDGAPEFDFCHEKLRSLVYEQTSLARRRLLHRRVAEALSRGRSREAGAMAAKVAAHYRLAGDDAAAASAFRRAGDNAVSLYAHSEALRHYRDALALGVEHPGEVHEAIGDLLVLQGDYPSAIAALERAAATADAGHVYVVEQKLGRVYHRLGEWSVASAHFASAREELGDSGSPAAMARLLADWSLTTHGRGDDVAAEAMAREAMEAAASADDDRALAQAHNLLGIIEGGRGNLDIAAEHLGRSLAIAEALGDPASTIAALNNLALNRRRAGDLEGAISLLRRALALSDVAGDRHREAALRNNLADLLQASGNNEGAMENLKQAVAIFAEIGASAGELQPEIWKLVEW